MGNASARDKETVVVLGGGVAGLGVALALQGSHCEVVIVERDQPPPEIDAAESFERWKRSGVFQFRHPHVFLGRLQRMLRDRYPDLLAELKRAGFWELPVSEYGIFRDGYQKAPEDDDLVQLCGRRATFEYVLQRYVRALPHVRVLYGTSVEGIALEGEGRSVRVRAVETKRGNERESLVGDVFIDCLGRRSPVFKWLLDHGRGGHEELQEAQTLAFSRHYRLHPGAKPQLREQSGDLDYLRFAIVYGEDGHFAISFSIAASDEELKQLVRRADGFDRVAHTIPQVRDWVEHADALTPVMGVGDARNRWVNWADRGRPLVLGLLHAGDSARETNPIYGRGCSTAFVDAHLVAEALAASKDPEQRARWFGARVRAELRPYYELAASTDRLFQARAMASRGLPISPIDRFVGHAYLKLAVPAAFEDHHVARVLLGMQHMRRPSSPLATFALIARMFYLAVRRLFGLGKPLPKIEIPLRKQITALAGEQPASPSTPPSDLEAL
jgi:2-polyprenyl-6-methoxyphenol hydroxylase-like FAD-dependent oxidoreductase